MPITLDHPALVKPDLSDIIYRYLDLDKFESFLQNRALFFCRSDKFSDPFEASCLKREVEYRIVEGKNLAARSNRFMSDEEAIEKSKGLADLHKRFRKSFVVNCWHINNKGESDAMWRLYLKSNEGVAIQSTIHCLIDSFQNTEETLYLSKVRYLDYDQDIYYHPIDYPVTSYNLLCPIVHKRNEFSHESELRIFDQINEAVNDDNYWNNRENYIGKNISCDISKLVNKIILPPTSDLIVQQKVISLIDKYNMSFAMEKSRLDDEPVY